MISEYINRMFLYEVEDGESPFDSQYFRSLMGAYDYIFLEDERMVVPPFKRDERNLLPSNK